MPTTPAWRRYLRFWGPDVDADIDDELRFHLEQLAADYEANGLSQPEAMRAALARFGDTAAIRGSLRAYDRKRQRRQERTERLRLLAQQLRVALRGLRRSPGFTISVVLTLALGIGLSTAVFDIASTLLLRPLPVRDERRLVVLSGRTRDGTIPNYPLPLDEARAFARASGTLDGVALVSYYGAVPQPVVRADRIVPMKVAQVSGNYFTLIGARPAIGRLLHDADDVAGCEPVAVLSHDAWVQYYSSDPKVLGTLLRVHSTGIAYTIVGVAAEGLGYPGQTDVWVPIATSTPPGAERFVMVNLIGRLAAGRSAEQARGELATFYTRPTAAKSEANLTASASSLRTVVLGDLRPAVVVFTLAAALLLLIACINVGTLMLVRVLNRVPELAVRSALGAGQRQLAGLVLTEGAVLASAGGAAGVLLAVLVLKSFRALAPATLPRLSELRSSWQTLAVAFGVTAFAAIAFAIVPAYRHSRVDAGEVLRAGTQRTAGRTSRRAAEWLVAAQIALAVVLLAGAALLGRSLYELERVDLAFDGTRLLVAELSLPPGEYDGVARQIALLDRVMPAIERLPGVGAVSPVVAAPFAGAAGWDMRPAIEGQEPAEAAKNPTMNVDVVGVDYFRALGVPVVQGRVFTNADREGAPRVIVVSRSAARVLWQNDAVGKRLAMAGTGPPDFTVVGVVEDTRYRDLREQRATIYLPLHQPFFPFAPASFVVRATGAPGVVLPALRRVVEETAPGVTIARAAPFTELLRIPLAQPRLNALLLALFAGGAVLLAAVGLSGAMATLVSQRVREIGIRMALGESPQAVRRTIFRRAFAIASSGVLAGLVGALLLGRAMASLLYAVRPTDPLTLAATTGTLFVVAVLASLLPARAASRVDPAIALRADT